MGAKKARATAKADSVVKAKAKAAQVATIASMACGFRNLMKYRASDQCKKAWGSCDMGREEEF